MRHVWTELRHGHDNNIRAGCGYKALDQVGRGCLAAGAQRQREARPADPAKPAPSLHGQARRGTFPRFTQPSSCRSPGGSGAPPAAGQQPTALDPATAVSARGCLPRPRAGPGQRRGAAGRGQGAGGGGGGAPRGPGVAVGQAGGRAGSWRPATGSVPSSAVILGVVGEPLGFWANLDERPRGRSLTFDEKGALWSST